MPKKLALCSPFLKSEHQLTHSILLPIFHEFISVGIAIIFDGYLEEGLSPATNLKTSR